MNFDSSSNPSDVLEDWFLELSITGSVLDKALTDVIGEDSSEHSDLLYVLRWRLQYIIENAPIVLVRNALGKVSHLSAAPQPV